VRTGDQRLKLGIAVTALVAVVAVILSSVALANRSSSRSFTRTPASGVYLNAASDRPHFFIALTNLGGGRVRGAVDFQYQDGQTSSVFTFRGTSQSLRSGAATGVLTLTPERVPSDTSAQLLSPPPSAVSATYGANQITLGECASYLAVTSLSRCLFALSSGAP
jgi:hypothetical protein